MKNKHTPGPWTIDEAGRLVVDEDGRLVADCWAELRSDSGVLLADLRLIAAAPDLLDELKSILESLRHGRSVETIHEARRIEVLIEKATGETP